MRVLPQLYYDWGNIKTLESGQVQPPWDAWIKHDRYGSKLISLCELYFAILYDIKRIIHLYTQLQQFEGQRTALITQSHNLSPAKGWRLGHQFGKKRYIGPRGGLYSMQYGRKKYLN